MNRISKQLTGSNHSVARGVTCGAGPAEVYYFILLRVCSGSCDNKCHPGGKIYKQLLVIVKRRVFEEMKLIVLHNAAYL